MAIENKKLKDPTEAALSAIEQALNLDSIQAAQKPDPTPDEPGPAGEPRLPDVEEHDFTGGPFRPVDPAPPEPEAPRAADPDAGAPARPLFVAPDRAAVANDDRQNVGMMLQALQVRPSRRAYLFAALASLGWLGSLGYIAYGQGITTPEALLAAYTPPQLALGGFVLLAPVLLFFIAALLAVRSQEMRLVAPPGGEGAGPL